MKDLAKAVAFAMAAAAVGLMLRDNVSAVDAAQPDAKRTIVTTSEARPPSRADAAGREGSWPSFRGPQASGVADGQHLPDVWDGTTRRNVLWRTKVPGLAHSSPIVWGDRVFVTSAISRDPNASFRPGLYGDGDASTDRSSHRWMVYAFDKRTGALLWERIAQEGVPREKRHIKSTYASSTPATDGRIVVAWFGSHGVHAYDLNGRFLWKVDLGRLDLGAYDVPSYEWGTASSPIIWNGLVILQCDTQARLLPAGTRRGYRKDHVENGARRDSFVGHSDRRGDIGRPHPRDQRVELHPRLRSAQRA